MPLTVVRSLLPFCRSCLTACHLLPSLPRVVVVVRSLLGSSSCSHYAGQGQFSVPPAGETLLMPPPAHTQPPVGQQSEAPPPQTGYPPSVPVSQHKGVAWPVQASPGQSRPGQASASQSRAGQARLLQARPSQARPGQPGPGHLLTQNHQVKKGGPNDEGDGSGQGRQ